MPRLVRPAASANESVDVAGRLTRSPASSALDTVAPLIEAVVALLHPHAEVAVHEVASDTIVAIWNPLSKRRVGDPALLLELPHHESHVHDAGMQSPVIGPYEKTGIDGHRMTSVSVPIDGGRYIVCINLDRHALDSAVEAINRFAAAIAPQPVELFERDWRENISAIVDGWCRDRQLARQNTTRAQRVELITLLDGKGLFATRGAALHVAHALDISRATVYSLLQEARS
jgi:D-arginine utilization repressor